VASTNVVTIEKYLVIGLKQIILTKKINRVVFGHNWEIPSNRIETTLTWYRSNWN